MTPVSFDQYLKEHRATHLEQLKEWLRIPSISALSAHKDDCHRAAQWLAEHARAIGLENVQVMDTKGNPVVYADWLHAPGAPTALIYGHYDVQPVDPLHLWQTPPFEPDIRDGKIFARGATDDKGQAFMHFKAVEALLKTEGKLPVNVKFLIEGEEEAGSVSLPAFIQEHRDLLQADVLVISDSSLYAPGQPSLDYGLRGMAGFQVDVYGANTDLHSGSYGGAVSNPLHALVQMLAALRHPAGRVAVPGFYDKVKDLTPAEREAFAKLPFDERAYMQALGVDALHGEPGYTPLERIGARPTLELNGIYGGFQGERSKTVLPKEAHAKITCRLVPDQDPHEIIDLVEAHLRRNAPPGVRVEIQRFDAARAVVVPIDHPSLQAAAAALQQTYGKEPYFTRGGGSIPVVETFVTLLKLPVVLMGFGLPTENLHAPNEHFHLENFDTGLRTLCVYWHELAKHMAR
jgi:acetylornithine deacetylase/succinyl-diaminopimelate desuccinylase-like protein